MPEIHPRIKELARVHAARLKDEIAIRNRRDREALAEKAAARGLGDSGWVAVESQKMYIAGYIELATRQRDEVLGLIRDVYGDIPPDALPWVREFLVEWIDGSANGLRQALRQEGHGARGEEGVERAHAEAIERARLQARRDLELVLGPIEIRGLIGNLQTTEARTTEPATREWDFFICHASEDKTSVALPIAEGLQARGYKVWIDRFQLTVGDRLLAKIDEGIAGAHFGVVILSPAFFEKKWPRIELAGLAAVADAEDRKVILPVWHDVDRKVIAARSPTLAAVLGTHTDRGISAVVEDLVTAVNAARS